MIPKIIHYCWLSNEPIPTNLLKCMDSWRKYCPEYEIIKWDTNRFDVHSVPLVEQAFTERKWAYAADYIRLYALSTMGGIYLDSDVMLYGDINSLLDSDFVSGVEYHPKNKDKENNIGHLDNDGNRIKNRIKIYGIGIQAAVLASVPNHPLLKRAMSFYEKVSLDYLLDNRLTAPTVLAYHTEIYGFKYKDEEQKLASDIHLFPTSIISHFDQYNKNSIAVHYCAGSWVSKNWKQKLLGVIKFTPLLKIFYSCAKIMRLL